MLFDKFRKKTSKPKAGGGGSELSDLLEGVEAPEVDGAIDSIDAALERAATLDEKQIAKPTEDCGCFGVVDYGGF